MTNRRFATATPALVRTIAPKSNARAPTPLTPLRDPRRMTGSIPRLKVGMVAILEIVRVASFRWQVARDEIFPVAVLLIRIEERAAGTAVDGSID